MTGWALLIAACAATSGLVFMLVRSGFATYDPPPYDTQRETQHAIRIRDLRAGRAGHEACAAECSCGWMGETHTAQRTGVSAARRDGAKHVDEHLHGRRR